MMIDERGVLNIGCSPLNTQMWEMKTLGCQSSTLENCLANIVAFKLIVLFFILSLFSHDSLM